MALNRKAQEVWQEASAILLNDDPRLDANEHVGLLTVIAGVRPVALFLHITEKEARTLIPLLREIHLTPIVAMGPQLAHTWESPHPVEITRVFRPKLEASGLWLCRNEGDVRTIKNGIDQLAAGQLLGYPRCCIDAEQRDQELFEDALVRGWTRELGVNAERIALAWREGRKVRIDYEPPDRIPRSVSTFPFVQHIACEACLKERNAPTVGLNREFETLVAATDPRLHGYLQRLGKRRDG